MTTSTPPNTPEPVYNNCSHSIRTALAALCAFYAAKLLGMPESYWAPIATMVTLQSTLGSTLTLSFQRILGTALGAVAGALLASFFHNNPFIFALGVFVLGIISIPFRLQRNAYRYAGVTLAVVMLIPRSNNVWMIATHRFIEVSAGILVGLASVALWPERKPPAPAPLQPS
jgi:uncharacterized membrane protein YgaE (UPF0421/DUF939 family)